MAKFLRTAVLGLAALVLGSSLVLAQTTPTPPPDSGKTPATTQTPKKKAKRPARKRAPAKKKRVKKPSTGTQQPG